ncbi:MAG: hypothetical protein ABFC24_06485 [Methanoregulaceae archaeon]
MRSTRSLAIPGRACHRIACSISATTRRLPSLEAIACHIIS